MLLYTKKKYIFLVKFIENKRSYKKKVVYIFILGRVYQKLLF